MTSSCGNCSGQAPRKEAKRITTLTLTLPPPCNLCCQRQGEAQWQVGTVFVVSTISFWGAQSRVEKGEDYTDLGGQRDVAILIP